MDCFAASRTTQSKAVEVKRVTRSSQDKQVAESVKEASEPKRGRGRPPTRKHEEPAAHDTKTVGREKADLKKKVVIIEEEDVDSSESGQVRPRPNKRF